MAGGGGATCIVYREGSFDSKEKTLDVRIDVYALVAYSSSECWPGESGAAGRYGRGLTGAGDMGKLR